MAGTDERHGAPLSARVHRYPVAIKNIAFADVGHTSKGIVLYVEDASSSIFSARGVQSCCIIMRNTLDSKQGPEYDRLSHSTLNHSHL